MAAPFHVPADFLLGPGPNVAVDRLDFDRLGFPEYADHYAVVLDDVLSAAECRTLVEAVEAHGGGVWEPAMVNVGLGQQRLRPDIRDCGRIMVDDGDVAERIWRRVRPHVPEIQLLSGNAVVSGSGPVKRRERWAATRLNERLRFLRYGPGQFFDVHADGSYQTPDGGEKSYYTLHLYLNGSGPARPLVGGATAFYAGDMRTQHDVRPKSGRVLLFQHRNLLHAGEEVRAGIKMTMRTDLMFRQPDA